MALTYKTKSCYPTLLNTEFTGFITQAQTDMTDIQHSNKRFTHRAEHRHSAERRSAECRGATYSRILIDVSFEF